MVTRDPHVAIASKVCTPMTSSNHVYMQSQRTGGDSTHPLSLDESNDPDSEP